MSSGIADRKPRQGSQQSEPRIVAVIDIGATSVRMLIAEILADGTSRQLESLAQSVLLGRDSFIKGEIRRATIEDCVEVLRVYRAKLAEYGVNNLRDVRVVATSAVREAENRLAFQDRVYIATGFDIEPFDEARLHRATYLGIRPILDQYPDMAEGHTVICEVGGGSTELLVMQNGEVNYAKTFRLGALRLIKTIEAYQASMVRSRALMESQIDKVAQQIALNIDSEVVPRFVVMGGDMRLAAQQIAAGREATPELDRDQLLFKISLIELEDFTNETMALSPDAIVKRFRLGINEAETLAPALMANFQIGRSLGVDSLYVAQVNLRDGLLKEMVDEGDWSEQADELVIANASVMAQRFEPNSAHPMHVEKLAAQIFDQTADLHLLVGRWRNLLRMAAVLHQVGLSINERSYHKHSMYIIRNSSFFGVSSHDLELVALIARYHRRALPQPRHEMYSSLKRDERVAISKLAAILRVAKALDASRSQRIGTVKCEKAANLLKIFVPGLTDLSLEQLELRRERVLFEYVFGLRAEILHAPEDVR